MSTCPLCDRPDIPDDLMQRHHLKTYRKDKRDTELVCVDCHKTIHGLWTNTQLRDSRLNLDTVEGILSNEKFQNALTFIRKQTAGTYVRMREARTRRKRH
jgi:5-methylcytosine-specific restriction enzyme A